jgi:phage gp29-like protein
MIDEMEERDDITKAAARKAYTAVSRCPHQILIEEGSEGDPRAKLHQDILTKFWATVRVQDAFARNASGGIRLLKKNMAEALSRVWQVHEIVWRPQADGTLQATFYKVPLWYFENRTGELRYLREDYACEGEPLAPEEWLVCQGDGVGIAAMVAGMAKRYAFQDWLLYCEKCGIPGVVAHTSAARGEKAWDDLMETVANITREWAGVFSKDVDIKPVSLAMSGEPPYPALVDRMDRMIATLYRGGDLSTISGQDQKGASLQGDESDMLDADTCEMISEALQQQVEPFVIRWACGDERPLAYIQIQPAASPNTDQDMKVDAHLASLGIKLSKRELLQRYGRTEYDPGDPDDGPAQMSNVQHGSPNREVRLANAAGGRTSPSAAAAEDSRPPETGADPDYEAVALEALAVARAKQLDPVINALLDALDTDDPAKLRADLETLYQKLPGIIESAGADDETGDLMNRILLGATQRGEDNTQGNTK